MNQEHLDIIRNRPGFVAALDQSGGSTPKALADYGVLADEYKSDAEMFALVHSMRTRIMTSPAFSSDKIIGTILFEQTMNMTVAGEFTGEFLANKGIVPFIKVDEGLAEVNHGVQLMKPLDNLDGLLKKAKERGMFGTIMRSTILELNEKGINSIVDQQFEVAEKILAAGLVPIIEPEVDIHAREKDEIEVVLEKAIANKLDELTTDQYVMLKLTLPAENNLYQKLANHPQVLRIVSLSGGYSRAEANEKLKKNDDLIASFSRALIQDLRVEQTEAEFDNALEIAIDSIYDASVNKNGS